MRFISPKTSPRRRTCERSFRTTAAGNCADCHLLPTPPPRRRPEGAHQTRTRRRSTENHRRPSTGTHGELRQAGGTLPGAHARQHPEGLQHGVRARRLHVDASARAGRGTRVDRATGRPDHHRRIEADRAYDPQPRLQLCRPGGPRRRQVPVEVVLRGVRRRNVEARRRAPRRRRLQRTRSLDPRSDPPGAVNPRSTRTATSHSWTPNWRRSSTPRPRGLSPVSSTTSSGGGSSSTT